MPVEPREVEKGKWCGEGRKKRRREEVGEGRREKGREGELSVFLFVYLFEETIQVPDSLTLMKAQSLQDILRSLRLFSVVTFESIPIITNILRGTCVKKKVHVYLRAKKNEKN